MPHKTLRLHRIIDQWGDLSLSQRMRIYWIVFKVSRPRLSHHLNSLLIFGLLGLALTSGLEGQFHWVLACFLGGIYMVMARPLRA